MKNFVIAMSLLLASSSAWAYSPTIVELPSQYKAEQVDAILHSIDFRQLAWEADKSVPGVIDKSVPTAPKLRVGFHFQPLVFHSFLGKADHVALRIDIHAPPNWAGESKLQAFLASYLEKRFPGAKTTDTALHGI